MPDTAPRPRSSRPRRPLARLRLIGGGIALVAAAILGLLFRRRRRQSPEGLRPLPPEDRALDAVRRRGHEPDQARVGMIAGFAIGLAVALVAIGVGLWGLLQLFVVAPPPTVADAPLNVPLGRTGGLPTATVPALPDRLPVRPADAAGQRETDEALLNTYGWVDQGRGVVHIPIDRAIDLLIERGLPAREEK